MIYLDNNATTQLDPAVHEAMEPWLRDDYGNPSAAYRFGKKARRAIDDARAKVAALIGADAEEILFTSGGTESNNTALLSATRARPERRKLVASAVEHSAIHQPLTFFQQLGYETFLCPVGPDGLLDLDVWKQLLTDGTAAFAALIWANNETGVISPVAAAAEAAREAGVYFHADAVQAAGKIPISVDDAPIHSLALSAHKFHGPKGIGALYVNRHTRFVPLLLGGGQESDRRSGTENVAGIVGMGAAAELAMKRLETSAAIASLRDRFEQGVMAAFPGTEINGCPDRRLPNTSNLYFPGIDGEGLLILLDERGLCCSPGSACSSGSVQPSRILKAMGQSTKRARGSVRFSLSHLNSEQEITEAIELIRIAAGKLKIY